MRTYAAISFLGTLLTKLGIDSAHEMRHLSWVMKLKNSLEKKQLARSLNLMSKKSKVERTEKQLADRRAAVRAYNDRNPGKTSEKKKRYNKRNPEKVRDKRLIKRYGITSADYEAMVLSQDSKCKICNKESKLVVDHNHVTLKVRSLLCDQCNQGLGLFKENKDSLLAAIEYLRSHDVEAKKRLTNH